jgi:hypothetical protein
MPTAGAIGNSERALVVQLTKAAKIKIPPTQRRRSIEPESRRLIKSPTEAASTKNPANVKTKKCATIFQSVPFELTTNVLPKLPLRTIPAPIATEIRRKIIRTLFEKNHDRKKSAVIRDPPVKKTPVRPLVISPLPTVPLAAVA